MSSFTVPEIKYRTKWFSTQLPGQICHAAKGDLDYRVDQLGEIFVNAVEDFQYYDVKAISLTIRFFGKEFLLHWDGTQLVVGENPLGPDLAEWEGILGHILGDFFDLMGLPELENGGEFLEKLAQTLIPS